MAWFFICEDEIRCIVPKAMHVGFTVQGEILTFVNILGQMWFCVTKPGLYNLWALFIVTHLFCFQDWLWSELFTVLPDSHCVVAVQNLFLILVPVTSHPLPFPSPQALCEPGQESGERLELWAVPYVCSSHAKPEQCRPGSSVGAVSAASEISAWRANGNTLVCS